MIVFVLLIILSETTKKYSYPKVDDFPKFMITITVKKIEDRAQI